MAALTFKNLQDDVLTWLDLAGNTGKALAMVKQQLNYHNQSRAMEYEWSFMVPSTPSDFDLVLNQRVYTLDPTVAKPIYFRNLATLEFLVETPGVDLNALDSLDWNNDSNNNRYQLRGNQTLVTLWKPATTDTIEYSYYKLPTDMVEDVDLPDIPSPFSRLLVWDTLLDVGAAYVEDLNAGLITLWRANQSDALQNLYRTFASGQTVGSEPTYIRSMDNDFY